MKVGKVLTKDLGGFGGYGFAMTVIAGILIASLFSGCSTSVTLETRRIDEYQDSHKMNDRPIKCWFVSCVEDNK